MKNISVLIFVFIFAAIVIARSTYTGYTRKTRTTGCSCHGSSANSSVIVEITGPAQLQTGATATYQVTISGGSGTKVAVDIAASAGTILPFDSALLLSGTELLTNGTKSYTNGKYTYSLNYTAPPSAGTQTLYATGLPSTGSGWNFAPDKIITITSATGVEETSVPVQYSLEQNYPNPFNPVTIISYSIPEESFVSLKIYDLKGREMKSLVDEVKSAGIYKIAFDASGLSSGVYFYRIDAGKYTQTKKFVLLK